MCPANQMTGFLTNEMTESSVHEPIRNQQKEPIRKQDTKRNKCRKILPEVT
jgi:hypothetical protein